MSIKFFQHSFLVIFLLITTSSLPAQEEDSYIWEEPGISLVYPAGWDEPLPANDDDGNLTLQLAQTLVDAPYIRPPGIPMITIKLIPDVTTDPVDLLIEELQEIEIDIATEPTESTLLSVSATEITGTNEDETLSGIGRAAAITDSETLIVIGRAAAPQSDNFLTLYNALTDSLILDREPAAQTVSYGVLWHTMRTLADGEEGFLNLVGLVDSGNRLYTYERDLGVIEMDAVTGEILNLTPNPDITDPSDLAVDAGGTVYVADIVCACIYMLNSEGEWQDTPIEGFSEGAPTSIVIAADGRLYATNQENEGGLSVVVFQNGIRERVMNLDSDMFTPPLLAADAQGRVLALTQYGELLLLTGETASLLYELGPLPDTVTDFTVDQNDHVIMTTSAFGSVILDSSGEEVERPGRIVPSFPLAGEFVSPVSATVGADGTLYFADSDGLFGAVTAMSTQVMPGRIGGTALALNLAVQASLDESVTQQTWTYEGMAGQQVTISAVDVSGADELNLALRLVAPDGVEEAYNDDHEGDTLPGLMDSQINEHSLAASGTYIVIVERTEGTGVYQLGIRETQAFTLDTDGVASLNGDLSEVLPVQRWQFEAQAGQTLTITAQPTIGTLDPKLRLMAPDGQVIAENDDADDPVLGTSAQIFGTLIPENGLYTIEVSRFDGAGDYELVIVVIA